MGRKTPGGSACPLSLLLSTGLTFGNCKLQKLARAKCLTLFDLQPYGVGREWGGVGGGAPATDK